MIFTSIEGGITLFNPINQEIEAFINNDFTGIRDILSLPDDRIAFITNNKEVKVYDFNTHYIITLMPHKHMSDTELSIKLNLYIKMELLLWKLKSWFTKPVIRREIITNGFEPYLKQIVFKYDYYLDHKIFSKAEGMSAITTLPNKMKLIAYANGTLNNKYPCPKNIEHMIAVSNEEIVIITKEKAFQKWNFITNTLLDTYMLTQYEEVKSLFFLPIQKIVGLHFNNSIRLSVSFVSIDHILSLKVLDDDTIIIRTYDGKLKRLDVRNNLSTLIHEGYKTIDCNIAIGIGLAYVGYFVNEIDKNIYQLPNGKLLCEGVIFNDEIYLETLSTITHTTILSDGRIVVRFTTGKIGLFNESKTPTIHNYFSSIISMVALPDNRVAFVSEDYKLRIFDLYTVIIYEIDKQMTQTELSIKLNLLK